MISLPKNIPGLRPFPNAQEPAFLVLEGNCPIIISAPHAGADDTTPSRAKAFGKRQFDPAIGGTFRDGDDTNTKKVTFAIVHTLLSLGVIPHVVINLVSRKYMDLGRPWDRQHIWQDHGETHHPGDENKPQNQFPRVSEFDRFRQSFYQDFHDTLRRFTTSQHPNGWLFDIHREPLADRGSYGNLQISTALGFTARRDYVYDNADNLHNYLVDNGFKVSPSTADPGMETINRSGDQFDLNLISGGRYGANRPPAYLANLPEPEIVVPIQSHRVHGVQFEIDDSIMLFQSDEQLETVGIKIANAIYDCLQGNRVIQGPVRSNMHIYQLSNDGRVEETKEQTRIPPGVTTVSPYTLVTSEFLLFVKRGGGSGSIRSFNMNLNGTMGNLVSSHTVNSGWTSVVTYGILGKTFAFMYRHDTGLAVVRRIGFNGPAASSSSPQIQLEPGWTSVNHYALLSGNFLIFANAATGAMKVRRVGDDGLPQAEIYSKVWTPGYTTIKPFNIGGKNYLFKLKAGNGTMHIERINDNGTAGSIIDNQSFPTGFKIGIPYNVAGGTFLFLLNPDTGMMQFHKIEQDGKIGAITESRQFIRPGWETAAIYTVGLGKYLILIKPGA